MRTAALLGIVACAATPDADGGADDTDDTDLAGDTFAPWSEGPGDTVPDDTFPLLDDPIGPTALDGTWTGSFTLRAFDGVGDPARCEGTATWTIDGDAGRHVVVDLPCDGWSPNRAIGLKYGKLTGVAFGTLDPADLAAFEVDLVFAARNLTTISTRGTRVTVDGDTLSAHDERTTGIGALKVGHVLDLSAARETP